MDHLEELVSNVRNDLLSSNIEESIKNANHILMIDKENHDALQMLGILFIRKHQYEEAENYFRRYLDVASDKKEAHWFLGETYTCQEKYDKALCEYNIILENDPKYVGATFGKANIYATTGEYANAVEYYLRTINNGLSTLPKLGWTTIISGKEKEWGNQIANRDTERDMILRSHRRLAKLYDAKGRHVKATAYLIRGKIFDIKTRFVNFISYFKP